MAYFQYVGDNDNPPQATSPYGYRFVLNGDPIEITDKALVKKFLGMKTFVQVEKPVQNDAGKA